MNNSCAFYERPQTLGRNMLQNGLISDSICVLYQNTNRLLFLSEQYGEKLEGIIRELDEAPAEVPRVVDTQNKACIQHFTKVAKGSSLGHESCKA